MINKILGFLLPGKLKQAFKAAQVFLAGKKTYIAATILLLEGILSVVEQIAGFSGSGDLMQELSSGNGFARIAEGLAVFGIRAAIPFKKAVNR